MVSNYNSFRRFLFYFILSQQWATIGKGQILCIGRDRDKKVWGVMIDQIGSQLQVKKGTLTYGAQSKIFISCDIFNFGNIFTMSSYYWKNTFYM